MDLIENESTSTIHINKISDKVRQINGQKIYRDVPESWVGEDPSRECEVSETCTLLPFLDIVAYKNHNNWQIQHDLESTL